MSWVLELIKPLTVSCFGEGRWSFFSQPEITKSPAPWTSWALRSCDEAARYFAIVERENSNQISAHVPSEVTVLVEKTSVQQGNVLWRTQLSAVMFGFYTGEFQVNSVWHWSQNRIVTVVFCVICHSFAHKDNKLESKQRKGDAAWNRQNLTSISNSHKHVTSALTCDQYFFSSDCSLIQRWITDSTTPSLGISPFGFASQSPSAAVANLETPKRNSRLQTNSPTGHVVM